MEIKLSIWDRTLLNEEKLDWLAAQCAEAASLPGSVAEVGVYRGGTANLMATILPYKSLYLFDTWDGMPEVDEIDGHKKGDFVSSLDETKEFLAEHENISFWPGIFPDSALNIEVIDGFCLVHVDVDLYSSTKAAIHYFWPRMVEGGIMVFDDYNHTLCKGANKAVDEFFVTNSLHFNPIGGEHKTGLRVVK